MGLLNGRRSPPGSLWACGSHIGGAPATLIGRTLSRPICPTELNCTHCFSDYRDERYVNRLAHRKIREAGEPPMARGPILALVILIVGLVLVVREASETPAT